MIKNCGGSECQKYSDFYFIYGEGEKTAKEKNKLFHKGRAVRFCQLLCHYDFSALRTDRRKQRRNCRDGRGDCVLSGTDRSLEQGACDADRLYVYPKNCEE